MHALLIASLFALNASRTPVPPVITVAFNDSPTSTPLESAMVQASFDVEALLRDVGEAQRQMDAIEQQLQVLVPVLLKLRELAAAPDPTRLPPEWKAAIDLVPQAEALVDEARSTFTTIKARVEALTAQYAALRRAEDLSQP